jgi:hypothetical protein
MLFTNVFMKPPFLNPLKTSIFVLSRLCNCRPHLYYEVDLNHIRNGSHTLNFIQ